MGGEGGGVVGGRWGSRREVGSIIRVKVVVRARIRTKVRVRVRVRFAPLAWP